MNPTRGDFLSDRESGKKPRDRSPDALRRNLGLSVWTSRAHARAAAARYPRLRERSPFIAEVRLPDDARLEPFPGTPDHLTAFEDPDVLVASVVAVDHVDLDER